jgi:CRP/FNR family transcriptional regulator, cyclic AMP receptor protein
MAGPPVDLLKRVPLFSDLDNRELQEIAGSMKQRTFSAGQQIAVEGESGVGFFLIEDGDATVTVHGDEVRRLGAGDYFGEIALIAQSPRTATVTADSDLKTYGMTFWDFRPLVEGTPSIAWKLLQSFAKQYDQSQQR